jgi:Sec-independent protein translocase protein TatA
MVDGDLVVIALVLAVLFGPVFIGHCIKAGDR